MSVNASDGLEMALLGYIRDGNQAFSDRFRKEAQANRDFRASYDARHGVTSHISLKRI